MRDCSNCEHSKFDETWGEHKCLQFSRRVHDSVEESKDCQYYKKTTKQEMENRG